MKDAAAAFRVFETTAYKWIARLQAGGPMALRADPLDPTRLHNSIPEHTLGRTEAELDISAPTVNHHL